MFKEALKSAIQMVFSIETAWQSIAEKRPNVYRELLIPLWTLIVLSSFIGGWLISRDGSIEFGVKNAISEIFTLFIGFYASSFFLNEYIKNLTDVEKSLKQTQIFVAYSSSLVYLVDIMVSLVNDLFFLWLFSLYTFYIVYVGAEIYYKIIPERKTNFMIIASLLILGLPIIAKYLLSMMMS